MGTFQMEQHVGKMPWLPVDDEFTPKKFRVHPWLKKCQRFRALNLPRKRL
jgi:hypothetical protein